MSKKTEKKISINTLKKAIQSVPDQISKYTVTIGDEQIEVTVNPYLSIEQYVRLINDIAGGCISSGRYIPSLTNIAIVSQVLSLCTNLPTGNIAVLHDFICRFPTVIEDIMGAFNMANPTFQQDVKATIQSQVDQFLHTSSFDLIAEKIANILDMIGNNLAGLTAGDVSTLTGLAATLANKDELGIAKAVLDYQKNKKQSATKEDK